MPKTRVFVYGTLRRFEGNHYLLDDASYVGQALTDAKYTMLHLGGYPGVIRAGCTSIFGELYDVDPTTIGRLDLLEGHPTFYRRTKVDVLRLAKGTSPEPSKWEQVSTYLLPEMWMNGGPVITSGDWCKQHVSVDEVPRGVLQ